MLMFMLLMEMSGCSEINKPDTSPEGDNTDTQTIYEELESLAEKEYKKIKITIVTNTNGFQLSAQYELSQYTVLYSIERFNMLPTDGNVSDILPEYKTTITGSAIVDDGEIIILDGANVTIPAYDELSGNFNFDENNLKNVEINNNTFKAEILSPSEFYGSEVNAQNMNIEVQYSDAALCKITITYQTTHSTVTTTYEFES